MAFREFLCQTCSQTFHTVVVVVQAIDSGGPICMEGESGGQNLFPLMLSVFPTNSLKKPTCHCIGQCAEGFLPIFGMLLKLHLPQLLSLQEL